MGKPKMTTFAQVLRLVGLLSEEEKATLRDVLRPERVVSKKARKRSEKIAVMTNGKVAEGFCSVCYQAKDHSDHDTRYSSSHPFESPKSATSAGHRSSSKKSTQTASTPSTETSSEGVAAAAGGSSE